MESRAYKQLEILVLTGVSLSQFNRWSAADLVAPFHGGGGGHGFHRRFSFFNLIEFELLGRLNDANVTRLESLRAALTSVHVLEHVAHFPVADGSQVSRQARRWKSFKARPSKRAGVALLVLRADLLSVADFIDDFSQFAELLEQAGDRASWIVIDIGKLVARLEDETGDRLE